MLLCWVRLDELLFLVISFGCEKFVEELGFLNEKLVISGYQKTSGCKWFGVSCFGIGETWIFL